MGKYLAQWWLQEIKDGRVVLTYDVYWVLRDLAQVEGMTGDEWERWEIAEPRRTQRTNREENRQWQDTRDDARNRRH